MSMSVELEEGFGLPFGAFNVSPDPPDAADDAGVVEEQADLVIVGGGYMAINAFEAAAFHLQRGSKVAIVTREPSWGGNWIDQYDYVRLHQPHRSFTAGARNWTLNQPPEYLATKKEILSHFEHIADTVIQEKSLKIVRCFEYSYTNHSANKSSVTVFAEPVKQNLGLPVVKITATRFVNASGGANVGIRPLKPLKINSSRVHSLAAKDVLSPEWNVKMQYSNAPIWVIGSGKTGIDAIKALYHSSLPNIKQRIRCVAGNGVWFMIRDYFNDHSAGLSEVSGRLLDMFDGTNGNECCEEMYRAGFFHSPIPNPGNFCAGICSRDEVETVKAALHPPEERIIKAHFKGVIDDEKGGLLMKLATLDGTKSYTHRIEEGAFIVNCSGHLPLHKPHAAKILFSEQMPIVPVVSGNGRVLNVPSLPGFGGPNGNFGTHCFYLDLLSESILSQIVRTYNPRINVNDKARYGLELWYQVQMTHTLLWSILPDKVKEHATIQLRGSPYGLQSMLDEPNFPIWLEKLKKISGGLCTDRANTSPRQLSSHL